MSLNIRKKYIIKRMEHLSGRVQIPKWLMQLVKMQVKVNK